MVLKSSHGKRSRKYTVAIGVLVLKALLTLAVVAGSSDLDSQPGRARPNPAEGAGSGTGFVDSSQVCSSERGDPCSGSSGRIPNCPAPWSDQPDTYAVLRSSASASTDETDRMICQEDMHYAAEQASAPRDSDAITTEAGPSDAVASEAAGGPEQSSVETAGSVLAEPYSAEAVVLDAKGDAMEEGQNFALGKEGAKIVAANKEARKADAILDCDGDTFLKNECKADKWLIIELSQVIKPTILVLSQYELYSGRIQDFEVRVRQDHPRHDGTDYAAKLDSPAWALVGRFNASNVKGSQSFRMPPAMPWAKYLQLRVLSHYGAEAVCALNDVRVYGKSAIEDFEDSLVKQERGVEGHAAFGHLGTLGGSPSLAASSGPLQVPVTAPAQPPAPDSTSRQANATSDGSSSSGGSPGGSPGGVVPVATTDSNASAGTQPPVPQRDAPAETAASTGVEGQDGGGLVNPTSGHSPAGLSHGGDAKETGSEGPKGPESPGTASETVGAPAQVKVSGSQAEKEGADSGSNGEAQTLAPLGEVEPAGDSGARADNGAPATELAPLSLDDWPSSSLVNGRQNTIFDMLVQDLKLMKLQQKVLPRQMADIHKNLSADLAALAAELGGLASRIGLAPSTQLARKEDADAVRIMQLQMEVAALQGSMQRLQRSQLGMGLLLGALVALLVLRVPYIHQEHRFFKLTVMVLALVNGIVGLLLQQSGGFFTKNPWHSFRLVA